ncbi:MAG: hypothetical protein HRF45_09340 [Fimbriimonadia bacterium]|jgi:hypothetical protein
MRSKRQASTGVSLALLALSICTAAAAQDRGSTDRSVPDWVNRISISGRAFLRYSYELDSSKDDFNEFSVDRVYLTFRSKVSEKSTVQYTLEGGEIRDADYRLSDGNLEKVSTSMDVQTKYFFFEVTDALYRTGFVRVGQAPQPWVPFQEDLWGYRVQGTVFSDRSGYLSSTDLGLSFGGTIPDGYGSWHGAFVNGEGWKSPERGKHKDFHFRATVYPFAKSPEAVKNLFVSGFFSTGAYDDVSAGPRDRERAIGQIGYRKAGSVYLGAEYLWASDPADKMKARYPSLAARSGQISDARGYSVYGVLNVGVLGRGADAAKWDILARFDNLDPDNEIADNDVERWIVGVSHRFSSNVLALLDYETVEYASGAGKPDERRISLRADIKF